MHVVCRRRRGREAAEAEAGAGWKVAASREAQVTTMQQKLQETLEQLQVRGTMPGDVGNLLFTYGCQYEVWYVVVSLPVAVSSPGAV